MLEKIATKTFWKIQSNVSPVFFSSVGPNMVHSGWVGSYAQDHRSSGDRRHSQAFVRAELMETHCLARGGAHSNPRRGILTQYNYCTFTFTSLFLSDPDHMLLEVGEQVIVSRRNTEFGHCDKSANMK